MSFLYLENDEVKITEEGKTLKEVKILFKTDKQPGKAYFKKCLKYIYYTYTFDGVFKNLVPSQKKKSVCERYCDGENWKKYEENKKIKAVIDLYIKLSTSLPERTYEGIKNDIDELLDHLKSIPFTRKQRVTFRVDGYEPVAKMVDADNSEEKLKAIASIEKLLMLEEKIKSRVVKDRLDRKRKAKDRLFDKVQIK